MDFSSLDPEQLKQRIAEIDAKIPSPAARAEVIYSLLQKQYGDKITTWDIACACVEMLGTLLPLYPWLESSVRTASRNLYYAHYFTSVEDVEQSIANSVRELSNISDTQSRDGKESDSTGPIIEGGET